MKRTFLIKNRIINWEGHRARLELSHDMYSTEYKLAKKDQERDALIRSVPGGLVRVDGRDMRTVLWHSVGFLDLIGYTEEQFSQELQSQWDYVHPDDRERIAASMGQARETGESAAAESRIVTRDGTVKILIMTYSYVDGKDSWDGVPSYYSVGVDVTEERTEQARQRLALEDACNAARIAADAKTNFLSSMSHDIRTPMNAIIGMSVIAKANLQSPEKIQDCLNKINVSSRHLLNLINEVLDMSKIESGKLTLTTEQISLKEVVEGIVNIMQPQVKTKKQTFDIHVENIFTENVWCDGIRLNQVLLNLLSNATKYTPEGGSIQLSLSEEASPKGEGHVRIHIKVKDNGIGMSPDFLKRIYEPYSRADGVRVSKTQGTGLGMAITKYIVEAMEGSLNITSELDKGTEVSLTFDFEKTVALEMDMVLPSWNMLVVDDDELLCRTAIDTLKTIGINADWVLSGEKAIELVTQHHQKRDDYQIILLDWKLPGMNGIQVAKEIRRNLGDEVPILLISAYDWSEFEAEAREAGISGFISKPLFKSTLYHALRQYMGAETENNQTLNHNIDLSGRRILLAEDNELNWEVAKELLSDLGVELDWAEDGQICLDKFQRSPEGYYDAILMDIRMPHMTGYEATKAIRGLNHPNALSIPIIAMSADAFSDDIQHCLECGMNAHIAKPIDDIELTRILKRFLI